MPYAAYNWTGFYLGAEGGGGWATSTSTVVSNPATSAFPSGTVLSPVDYSGVLGGFYAGGNYQINQFVIGIDGDYNWSGLTGSGSDLSPIPGNGSVVHSSDKMNWVSTVTGRLGYANNNWLFFAKGGWAWAGFNGTSFTDTATGALSSTGFSSSTRNGWTLGGGLEWGLAAHWSAKLEYDYVQFDTANFTDTSTNVTTGGVGVFPRSATSYLNILKAGLAYRF